VKRLKCNRPSRLRQCQDYIAALRRIA
jgi:hypothetical protein